MSKPKTDPRIVFLDLETTGLDPAHDVTVEIGIVLISRRLRDVPGGRFSQVVKVDIGSLSIDQDVREMHQKNGLFDECVKVGVSHQVAEQGVLSFLEAHDFDEEDKIVIGGFSPAFDASFLRSDFPRLAERLSHRTFDVSTIRDLIARLAGRDVYTWRDSLHKSFPEANLHRALPDCDAAIRELREYVKFFDLDAMREAIASTGGGNA